ncbi:hypothetical protein PUNSTDRAFT_131528 [Punctularia strigosozonata HHB-11173 SS5]|uniref:uncharacterized protein n=1 Tax=Punctularia strigosozonata (strain HHB-11173) TaxID=741275 RepID=UPI0004416933|nr:uncharacterized protein PUNSTDRAFT_131528 [Punctularia strigosozonata HHB-11173 SS5]EIN11366.1 hypothetical protein PUNSTDRAFT_131528 [Punctularia strigosozonata HHB-11173 SS5]
MATVHRRPLSMKAVPLNLGSAVSPFKATSSQTKRPRSPEAGELPQLYSKRPKPLVYPQADAERKERDRRRAEREAQKEEFRVKYRKAFPSWVFYFNFDVSDGDAEDVKMLQNRVINLGGRVDDFFSNDITHLITNLPIPAESKDESKENSKSRAKVVAHRSPSKPKNRGEKRQADDLVVKEALKFGMKIWNMYKLESVLERCMPSATSAMPAAQPAETVAIASGSTQRSLRGLLESERRGGLLERDPTQRRHDFRYFSKGSYFVLVEDMWQQLAPIAIQEYAVRRDRDGTERGDWPVLHCHPQARGPFIEFDERERRKWEKQERAEREQEAARLNAHRRSLERKRREAQLRLQAQSRKSGDLRRTVSLANLHRRESNPDVPDADADGSFAPDSANASGYLASGPGNYMAASGNSVGITSTTGTTSTAGSGLRGLQLSASLQDKLQRQVVTSRKVTGNADADKENSGLMGPPSVIPERRQGFLKKAKSTNTLRLPKRDEGSKPGYCESCRTKFEDFAKHVNGSKHRRFAMDDANFAQLDAVLARVTRRPLEDTYGPSWIPTQSSEDGYAETELELQQSDDHMDLLSDHLREGSDDVWVEDATAMVTQDDDDDNDVEEL